MAEPLSIAAYINADSQNAANMQYRKIIRYVNEVLPGSTCFFFCDHDSKEQVEFNRLMYLVGKKKFTHIVTCSRDNLPPNIMSILQLADITLSVVHDNSMMKIIQYKKEPESF